MAANTIRCNDCGNTDITIFQDGSGLGRCRACGALVILPKQREGEVVNLLNIAYLQRAECNFDSALSTYRFIVEKDAGEVAAYEGMLLSKYGIEYVRDRRYNKYVPTCHRTHFKSVYEDEDYQKYLTLCTPEQKLVFEKRAKEIDELQHAIARQLEGEENFDVFVCYKAADEQGRPTEDSALARDAYDELVGRGYRVFFAEKTLESRLGENYEPIIFKALQTSRVFILVGTKREHVESVWVRNEWSRFLDRIRDPADKAAEASAFIPVFKEMSPYDMPKLGNRTVQGVDAGRIGWVKLLADGVERLMPVEERAEYDWHRPFDPFIEETKAAGRETEKKADFSGAQTDKTAQEKSPSDSETQTSDRNREDGYGTQDFFNDVKHISRNVVNNVRSSVQRGMEKLKGKETEMTEKQKLRMELRETQQAEKQIRRTQRIQRKEELRFKKEDKLRRKTEKMRKKNEREQAKTEAARAKSAAKREKTTAACADVSYYSQTCPPQCGPTVRNERAARPVNQPSPAPMRQPPYSFPMPSRTPQQVQNAAFSSGEQTPGKVKSRIGKDIASYMCLVLAVLFLTVSFRMGRILEGTPSFRLAWVFSSLLWVCFLLCMILFLVLRFRARNYAKGSTASGVRGLVITLSVLLMAGTAISIFSGAGADGYSERGEAGHETRCELNLSEYNDPAAIPNIRTILPVGDEDNGAKQ